MTRTNPLKLGVVHSTARSWSSSICKNGQFSQPDSLNCKPEHRDYLYLCKTKSVYVWLCTNWVQVNWFCKILILVKSGLRWSDLCLDRFNWTSVKINSVIKSYNFSFKWINSGDNQYYLKATNNVIINSKPPESIMSPKRRNKHILRIVREREGQ